MLQSVGGLALAPAGGLAVSSTLLGGQEHHHVTGAEPDSGQNQNWKPQFFNAGQNDILVAMGERIVPGSTAAGCNRVIDLMMTIESDKNRHDLTQALADFNAEARKRHQKPFAALTPEQQDALLSDASAKNGRSKDEFQIVKDWVGDAYWTSEPGLRYLGWTGQVAWGSFPNCGNPQPHN